MEGVERPGKANVVGKAEAVRERTTGPREQRSSKKSATEAARGRELAQVRRHDEA